MVATTTASPGGSRLLHVLNPTGYPAQIQLDVADATGLLRAPLLLPETTGRMLPLGLTVAPGVRIASANAEIVQHDRGHVTFGPGLDAPTVVWVDARTTVASSAQIESIAGLTRLTEPSGSGLTLTWAGA